MKKIKPFNFSINEGSSMYVIDLEGTKDTIRDVVYQRIADDEEQYPDAYGNLSSFDGVKFAVDVMKDDQEAFDFIKSKSKKWGDMIAVPRNTEKTLWTVGGWMAT